MEKLTEIQRYEADFFDTRLRDAIARDPQFGVSRISPRDLLHSIAEDPVFLDLLGNIQGKTVLDLCCGLGKSSVVWALRGARKVVGIDLSSLALDIARRNALLNQVADRIEFQKMPAEDLDFPDESFDVIVGIDALHHTDLSLCLHEIFRVLCKGGQGVFIETTALNPVMMWARRYLAGHFGILRCQNQTEHPLTRRDFELMAEMFSRVRRVGTALLFELRRLPPLSSWELRLHRWDQSLFHALPWLRALSYYQAVQVVK